MGSMTAAIVLLTALGFLVGNGQSAKVCYPEVGCFNDEGCHALGYPPDSPDEVNTRFFLYTRTNPDTYQELFTNDVESLTASNFDASKKTKFTIHGWTRSSNYSYEQTRKDNFLQAEDCNVIMVDWRDGAAGDVRQYPTNTQNCQVAGRETGLLMEFLVANGALYSDMHMVGHSLGGHVCGYAGEFVSGAVGRITALQKVIKGIGTDPAGPPFVHYGPECRLDPTDAVFVDVIHSDAGEMGIALLVGHQDYFPNGGTSQPGCDPLSDLNGCSHAFSDEFFNESIISTDCAFTAYPCASEEDASAGLCDACGGGCSEMGYHADEYKQLTGTFYLVTNAQSPFCKS